MEPGTAEAGSDEPVANDTGTATRLDGAMPWLMAGWAVLGFFSLPIDERFHVENGRPLTALLTTVAVTWSALAAAAIVLAMRHARATRGLAVFAWSAVPAVLLLATPVALTLLAEHDYTEDEDAICSPGLLPAGVPDALFSWIPWPAYAAVPAVAGLTGLLSLATERTRRAGAGVLASTLMGISLWMSAAVLINNHCD